MKRPDSIYVNQKSVSSIDSSSSSSETTEWGSKQKSVSSSGGSFSFSVTMNGSKQGSTSLNTNSKPFYFQGKGKWKQSVFTSLSSFKPSLFLWTLTRLSLFYGWSSVGRSHPKNWSNTNPLSDYESIDWTLEALLMLLKKSPSSKMSTSMSAIMHTLRSASTTAASSSSSSVCLWEWRSPSVASD